MKRLILIAVLCLFANGIVSGQGKFIKDGKTFIVNQKFIDEFDAFARPQYSDTKIFLGDIRRALVQGETVEYDSYRNTISSNVYFTIFSERQNKRLPYKKDTRLKATFNTKFHRFCVALESLQNFNPTPTK